MEACWAHNPEVRRSKLRSASNTGVVIIYFFLNDHETFIMIIHSIDSSELINLLRTVLLDWCWLFKRPRRAIVSIQ